MKFQNGILISFERTHGRTDRRMDGQAESNMPLVGGHKYKNKTKTKFWTSLTKLSGSAKVCGGYILKYSAGIRFIAAIIKHQYCLEKKQLSRISFFVNI